MGSVGIDHPPFAAGVLSFRSGTTRATIGAMGPASLKRATGSGKETIHVNGTRFGRQGLFPEAGSGSGMDEQRVRRLYNRNSERLLLALSAAALNPCGPQRQRPPDSLCVSAASPGQNRDDGFRQHRNPGEDRAGNGTKPRRRLHDGRQGVFCSRTDGTEKDGKGSA
jgi:hypothetical protein